MTKSRLQTWQQFDPHRKPNNAPNLVTPAPAPETSVAEVPAPVAATPPVVETETEIVGSIDRLIDEDQPKAKPTKKIKE